MKEGYYEEDSDFMPYYLLQKELKQKVISYNDIKGEVRYIAGADVAYNDATKKMVGALVVLDANTLQVVEQQVHEMEVTFPYVPGLFSFREVPPLVEAFKKLQTKPDLIICDAHGMAHPNGMGMATHLGLELDIPTIGCAKSWLVGIYDKSLLGLERGATQPMMWDSKIVGVALRTQDNVKPLFVSVGHRVDLQTAIDWVLKMSPSYRQPETTRQADHLVNSVMKERMEIDFMGDEAVEEPI
ncbi:unnamed protein product [Darwinula stevensoni]|uniref:Uncharacterized protein n=1 Tax=Darwinula stevensoni TaxID=69355 RepID=A0A7R8XHY4_9CRUS|nr:unnamed protein product [Darwinula stevensoni]CAG0893307.1 unnamed protein product [Darwinula stevensoni]